MQTRTNLREKAVWVAVTIPCALWATLDVEKQENAEHLLVERERESVCGKISADEALLHQQIRQPVISSDSSVCHLLDMAKNRVCGSDTIMALRDICDPHIHGFSYQSRHFVITGQTRPEYMAAGGGLGAAVCVTQNLAVILADLCNSPVTSAAGLLRVGLKSRQDAFERILLLAFAFAPDFMLLSASWEPFFLWNYTAILLCWMWIERAGAISNSGHGQQTGKKQTTRFRTLKSSDACRGLVFLFLVHAVSILFFRPFSSP